VILIVILAFAAHRQPQPVANAPLEPASLPSDDPGEMSASLAARYDSIIESVELSRREFARKFSEAGSSEAHRRVVADARDYLLSALLEQLMPAWYGTRWSWNGHSERPREGGIACGFFVTTILRDAGFRLNRIAMGRQPAENIIKNLTDEPNIRRYSNRPISQVKQEITEWGRGLYIVGLDLHVGFVACDGVGPPRFIHSSVYWPAEVVCEDIDTENPLKHSRYRVFGRILTDRMIVKWLRSERFPLVHDYFSRPSTSSPVNSMTL
jgi:hypothetical protein